MKRKREKKETFDDKYPTWEKEYERATGKWADKLQDFRDAAESKTSF